MADDPDHIRVFLVCERIDGSPPEPVASDILFHFVRPAIPDELSHNLEKADFRPNADASLDHYDVDMMAEVDLVVCDLTRLSKTADFLVGAREPRGLPVVYICDEVFQLPFERSANIVRYSRTDYGPAIPALRQAILEALDGVEDAVGLPPSQRPPGVTKSELANRIQATAEAIRELRLNSAGDEVQELFDIVEEMRKQPDDTTISYLQQCADKALTIIFRLMDELATKQGARLTISGAIGLIVGGTGVSGAAAFTAALAFWSGKEAFGKWIERRKQGSIAKKKSKS